ncbi:MAG TPA: amino acid permease C-terminal domain-containing protein, partial [Flavipsychrobacter sp.]|nr:amino acid permease C-terminal domain-containing protein [Flavipsychrobacter sp.]
WLVPLLFLVTLIGFHYFSSNGILGFFTASGSKVGWEFWREKIPYIGFGALFLVVTILSFIKNYSLIPVLGLLSCSYLLAESGATNWERFLIWLTIGLVIYFLYGKKHSKLASSKLDKG